MRQVLPGALLLTALGLMLVSPAYAQSPGNTGIRLGLGTDISGGIAYGGQVNYTIPKGVSAVELGVTVFGGSFTEDSNNGFNDYHETTDVVAFGVIANYLIRHSMETEGPYFVVGAGFGAFSVEWREESPTDGSLGPPLSGGGSYQEEDGSAGGAILNFGIGHRFSEEIDLRAQVPTFFIGGGDQRSSQVVPTFTITVGVAF